MKKQQLEVGSNRMLSEAQKHEHGYHGKPARAHIG
jgi:hypothetical protein